MRIKNFYRMLQQHGALYSGGEQLAAARQQRTRQLLLKPLDFPAHRRLAEIEQRRGMTHIAGLHYRSEYTEGIDRKAHRHFMYDKSCKQGENNVTCVIISQAIVCSN